MNFSNFLGVTVLALSSLVAWLLKSLIRSNNNTKILKNELTRQKRGSKIERENQENKQNFNHNELVGFVSRRLPDGKS